MDLLQMSISGAVLILGVVLIRLVAMRAVPKRTFLVLWALVLVRLLVPFPPLVKMALPMPEGWPQGPAASTSRPTPVPTAPLQDSAHPAVTMPRETAIPAPTAPRPAATAAPTITQSPRATVPPAPGGEAPALSTAAAGKTPFPWQILWMLGSCLTAAVFAFLYGVSYGRFRRGVPLETPEAAAWLAAHPLRRRLRLRTLPALASPLTYGVFRPVILLPEGLDLLSEETTLALEHEYIHARRLDALWKLLLMAAAAVHWCNPFVWLMWFLANRDLELSCDEEVLRRFGTEKRGDYARTLLAMEERRSLLPPLHSGFGAGATKERILAIMKYKKATVLSVALAAVLIAVLAACALSGRTESAPEPTAAPAPTAVPTSEPQESPVPTQGPLSGEHVPFESGGLTLHVPGEYADELTVETGKGGDDWGYEWETLFTVTETASREAGQKQHPGEDWGDGWLFSIVRVGEETLGKMMRWDMSGVSVFARETSGDYLLLLNPTDVRFLPEEGDVVSASDPRWQRWEAMNDWAYGPGPMTERFLLDNESLLTPYRHDDTVVSSVLARVLYYDPAEYPDKEAPLIRCGDGEGADPLGTPLAREDARRLLWGFTVLGPGSAEDIGIGAQEPVTIKDPLTDTLLSFWQSCETVGVTAGDQTDYFFMAPTDMSLRLVGSDALRWYFHAAGILSGEALTVKNGKYALSLPWEDAEALYVETPEVSEDLRSFPGDEMIFRVSEKASRERWDSGVGQWGDTYDGWFFSIRRMWPHYLGRAYVAGSSGWAVFARDDMGTFYVYDYPIWLTFCPEEGQEPEGEALQRYWALYRALGDFGIQERFITDNRLRPFTFFGMRSFLCSTLYDSDALAQATLRLGDGPAYPAEWVRNALSDLLWGSELTELHAPAAQPEETPIILECGGTRLVFWPDSDLCMLDWGDGQLWYRGGGAEAAAVLEAAQAVAAEEARVAAALPARSGQTVSYENRGVTLVLPEEYIPYLIVDLPESGGTLFRVLQRSSWENGQKKHPGEDWGDGWLFSLERFDEEEFLWEVRVHPTPTAYVSKDAEGGYYILRYPSDVRYVGEGNNMDPGDESVWEWRALCRWSQGLAEERVVSGVGLTAFSKSFCRLETVLAACLTENYREDVDLRFLDGDGRELDALAAPDWEDIARQLLTECSSYDSSEGTGGGSGQRIELIFTLPYNDIVQITAIFAEGSIYFEEVVDYSDGKREDRAYRMSFYGAGQTVGDLMAKWYREAAEAG